MRVRFKTEGGVAFFPGLSRPVTIDSGELPENEAVELRRRVEEARFFDLPPTVGEPPPGAADYLRHTITVEDEDRSHTARVTDPVEDPALRALVGYLDAKRKAMRRASRTANGESPSTTG